MIKRFVFLTGTLVLALVAFAALAQPAAARRADPPGPNAAPAATPGTCGLNGAGLGRLGPEQSLIDVAAAQLHLTRTDLVAALQGGQSIAAVATAHGVAPATIVDAFLAPRAAALQEAVAAGRITQAQADTMLAAMRTHVTEQINAPWSPRGPGQGTGMGTPGSGPMAGRGMGRNRP